MALKHLIVAGMIMTAGTLVGCSKESDAEKAAKTQADQLEKAGDQVGGQAEKDLNKQAADLRDKGEKATDAKDAAVKDAQGKIDVAKDTADAANSGVENQAKTLLDQANAFLKDKKFDEALKVVSQLEGLKSQLPANWAAQIDQLKMAVETAKKANITLPGGM